MCIEECRDAKAEKSRMECEKNQKMRAEFEVLAKPLIKFINDNYHPHTTIIVTPDSAEILIGEMSVYTEEFIKD